MTEYILIMHNDLAADDNVARELEAVFNIVRLLDCS